MQKEAEDLVSLIGSGGWFPYVVHLPPRNYGLSHRQVDPALPRVLQQCAVALRHSAISGFAVRRVVVRIDGIARRNWLSVGFVWEACSTAECVGLISRAAYCIELGEKSIVLVDSQTVNLCARLRDETLEVMGCEYLA